jgi:hypothetical protein
MTTLLPEAPLSQTNSERYDSGAYEGVIQMIGKEGDSRIMWDRTNKVEVGVAKAAFDAAIKGGAMVYVADGKEGARGEQVKKFDAKHERLIVVPPLQGG